MTPPVSEAAATLIARGFAVCKVDPQSKCPSYPGWSTRSLGAEDFQPSDWLGVIGGPLSTGGRFGHALVIVDLDSAEAIRMADEYLPATALVEGRPSKPRSHRYYLVRLSSIPTWGQSPAEQAAAAARTKCGHPGPFKKGFQHRETNERVIDFIGTGGQVVAPPSLHPSGEIREWTGGEPGEPAVVPFTELWDSCGRLASACGAAVPRVIPQKTTKTTPYLRRPWEPRPVTRAVSYLKKLPGAVSGQNGHNRAFWVARVLVTGFRLQIEDALRLLLAVWNPKCQPEWSERELRHKLEDAENLPFGKPAGWMLKRETT